MKQLLKKQAGNAHTDNFVTSPGCIHSWRQAPSIGEPPSPERPPAGWPGDRSPQLLGSSLRPWHRPGCTQGTHTWSRRRRRRRTQVGLQWELVSLHSTKSSMKLCTHTPCIHSAASFTFICVREIWWGCKIKKKHWVHFLRGKQEKKKAKQHKGFNKINRKQQLEPLLYTEDRFKQVSLFMFWQFWAPVRIMWWGVLKVCSRKQTIARFDKHQRHFAEFLQADRAGLSN